MPVACCSASTSVGAISAPWWPPCTAASSAVTATTVLPGADVTLQQPVHRVRRGEVGVDLGDHPPLGVRQREAQRGVEAAHQLAADLVADADGVPLHRPLAHHEHELHAQQLVEGQPPPGVLLVGDRLGQVDVVQRRPPLDQAQPPAGGGRHGVGRDPVRDARCNAFSTQPAISHVLIWAFSLCG